MPLRPILLAAVLTCVTPLVSVAQTFASPGINPSRPDQNPSPRSERLRPAAIAPTSRARARIAPIAPFNLTAVRIDSSSLPPPALEAAWRPYLGRTMDTRALVDLIDALSAVYEAHDIAIYTLAVPEQAFAGGALRIQALEGHIEEVQVTGATAARHRALLDRYAARLRTERPMRGSTLQRYVSLIRDIPGLNAEVDLRNGRAADGVILAVALSPDPVQVGLSINNRGTPYLGRTQMQADIYLHSLFRQGDRTRLTAAAPTDFNRFQAFAVEHSEPLGPDGLTLTANAGYVRTRPAGTAILGHAASAGLQLSYPLLRSYDRDAYVTLGVDGVDADNAFLGFTFSDERTRAVRAAISYRRQTPLSLVYGSATLSQSLDALGARAQPAFSDIDFRKLNARMGVAFALGPRWVVRIAGAGQATGDRLPATEQFALGGEEFGRAYGAAAIAGDYGFGASVEAAWRPAGLPALLAGSEAYGFADGGKIWYRGRLGAGEADADLRSVGLGLRAALGRRSTVQLEAAKALPNKAPLLDDQGWRGVFAIRTLF